MVAAEVGKRGEVTAVINVVTGVVAGDGLGCIGGGEYCGNTSDVTIPALTRKNAISLIHKTDVMERVLNLTLPS
jgi:hypothetical protein